MNLYTFRLAAKQRRPFKLDTGLSRWRSRLGPTEIWTFHAGRRGRDSIWLPQRILLTSTIRRQDAPWRKTPGWSPVHTAPLVLTTI